MLVNVRSIIIYPQVSSSQRFASGAPTPDWYWWRCPALGAMPRHLWFLISFILHSKSTFFLSSLTLWDPFQKFTYLLIPKDFWLDWGLLLSQTNHSGCLSGWLYSQGLEARVPINVQKPRPSTSCLSCRGSRPHLSCLCLETWASFFWVLVKCKERIGREIWISTKSHGKWWAWTGKQNLSSSFRPSREGWRIQENEARNPLCALSASHPLTRLLPLVSGPSPPLPPLRCWAGWKVSAKWPPWFLSADVPQPRHKHETNGSGHCKSPSRQEVHRKSSAQ